MFRFLKRTFFTENSSLPRKLIFVYLEDKSPLASALSRRIQSDLKAVHLNTQETDRITDSAQVPFTVIISNRTLTDGILELRHFNPKIVEEVHVCDVAYKLLQQTGAVMLRGNKM